MSSQNAKYYKKKKKTSNKPQTKKTKQTQIPKPQPMKGKVILAALEMSNMRIAVLQEIHTYWWY